MTSNIVMPTLLALALLSTPAAGLLDEVKDQLDCDLALEVTFTAYLGTITGRRDNDHSFLVDKFLSFETVEQTPIYEWLSADEYHIVGYEETIEEHDLDVPIAVDVSWEEQRIKWRDASFSILVVPWGVFDAYHIDTIVPTTSCDDTPVYSGLDGFLRDRGHADYTSLWQEQNGWYAVATSLEIGLHLASPSEREKLAEEDPYDVAYDISDDGYAIYVDLNDAIDEYEPTLKQLQAWWPSYST